MKITLFSPRLHSNINLLVMVPVYASIAFVSTVSAASFSEARFVEIVNDVRMISLPDRDVQVAELDQVLRAPDLVQTGRRSRAQLKTEDGTIARVGSNTVFSFDRVERSVDLEQGSILFHSPTGQGGGRIVTASATASVLGTTIIVAATNDGGFKVLVLEGTAQVEFPDGSTQLLNAGQMTFVLPSATPGGPSERGPVLDFDLEAQLQGSALVNEFSGRLESMPEIDRAVQVQRDEIMGGELQPTGLVIIGANDDVSVRAVDASQLSIAVREGDRSAIQQLRALLDSTVTLFTPDLPESNTVSTPLVVSPADLGFTAFNPPERIAFVGLAAGTVILETSTVDFSPLDGANEIFLLADKSLQVNSNVTFTGFEDTKKFTIVGQDFDFGSNSISANFPYGMANSKFSIISRNDFSLMSATISNSVGDLDITAQGLMTLTSTDLFAGAYYSPPASLILQAFSMNFDGLYASSSGQVLIESTKDIVIANSQILAGNSGGEFFVAMDGFDVEPTPESGPKIDLSGVTVLDLNVVTLTASQHRLQANDISLSDVSFQGTGGTTDINMTAKTIVLDAVSFPGNSDVYLSSQHGQLAANPNTGATPLPGFVNFVNNVTYDGTPAQHYVPVGAGGSASPGNERIFINPINQGGL